MRETSNKDTSSASSKEIKLPDFALVALIGASGSGKSTFAREHFAPTEVLSSDAFRGLVADDVNDQKATDDAFEALYHLAGIRLRRRRLTVIDATNVQAAARRKIVALAREHHALPIAIVLDLPKRVCIERNERREDRRLGHHVVPQQTSQLKRSLRGLRREGFRNVFVLSTPEEADGVSVRRVPLWTDKRELEGPFDIIGDVHGCFDELRELLEKLGYRITDSVHAQGDLETAPQREPLFEVTPPEGRKAVFVGDIVDRGPKVPESLRLVMDMVQGGQALCVLGNHENKLLRKLRGKNVKATHGLQETLDQLENEPEEFTSRVRDFLHGLVSHFTLDDGRLVVAHAGLTESLQGRASGVVRSFALYGDTTGEVDEFGLPVRHEWAREYRGRATVVYGHTPTPEAEWLNKTICVDTGCVFGGSLTALRYPELELVSVEAKRVYSEPIRPLAAPAQEDQRSAQQAHDDLLDFDDVSGKRIISTRLRPSITIHEDNASAALEVMSRFAIDPRWLIYLPPTMAPCGTSERDGFLEHAEQALGNYRRAGIQHVVCEQKHMGSRAVLIVCRDEAAAERRFGIAGHGVCYTRTGRPFFGDTQLERQLLLRVREAFESTGLWNELESDWVCLDCELMPWSAKARALLQQQYAATGAAGRASLGASIECLESVEAREGIPALLELYRERLRMIDAYVDAYREYCWPVKGLEDYRLAPFHILASEGRTHVDRDHVWHMETIARACAADPLLLATPYRVVELESDRACEAATDWWLELVGEGGEGMVVKPLRFVERGKKGLVQPAVKCRGPEYLRIIYGPEYLRADNLARLRSRSLGRKRSLALREFALGVEGLERFVRGEPLRRVHECVFGTLALESEPVDPRL